MTWLGQQARDRRALATALLACVLVLRLLVPTGFMPATTAAGVAIVLCDGTAATMAAMPGMHHGDGKQHAPAKSEPPCPYAAAATPALGGADPLQLALALAMLVAAALFFTPLPPLAVAPRLRPPLRGPPLPS